MKKLMSFILLFSITIVGCEENDCIMKNRDEFASNGCGDFMVYIMTNVTGNLNSFLIIEVERQNLKLSNEFTSFKIQDNINISSTIMEYNNIQWAPFCTDMIDSELELLKTWNLKSGIAEIRIVKEESECDESYVVDLILKDAIFNDNEMNEISIQEKIFLNILVNKPQFDFM